MVQREIHLEYERNVFFAKAFVGSENLHQGSNCLFRTDPQKFFDLFQQPRSSLQGSTVKSPHWRFGDKAYKDFGQNAIQTQQCTV